MKFLLKPIYSPVELAAIAVFTTAMPNTWWSWAILVAFLFVSFAVEAMDPRRP